MEANVLSLIQQWGCSNWPSIENVICIFHEQEVYIIKLVILLTVHYNPKTKNYKPFENIIAVFGLRLQFDDFLWNIWENGKRRIYIVISPERISKAYVRNMVYLLISQTLKWQHPWFFIWRYFAEVPCFHQLCEEEAIIHFEKELGLNKFSISIIDSKLKFNQFN